MWITIQFILTVILPLPIIAQQYGAYTARNGRSGECISTRTCAANNGVSDPANLCPGGNHIQCCTVGSTPTGPGPSRPVNTMLTGSADILRGAGLNVVEVAAGRPVVMG